MLIIILALIFGVLIFCAITNDYNGDKYVFMAAVAGVILLIALLILPISIVDTRSNIENYHATKETIERARNNKNISDLELAALQHKIVEVNRWLRREQYWNKNVLVEIYILDEVDFLQPIE